VEHQVLTIS